MIKAVGLSLLLAMLAGGAAPAAHAAPTDEEVKAAVAFNILQFVKWPADSLQPGQPLVLCTLEGGGVGKLLARFNGATVNGANLVFRRLNRHLDGLGECKALFVSADDPYAVLRVSAATQGKPVLLIAEGEHAIEQGAGMVLSLSGGRVVLDVDLASLTASGLTVSSKLLRLARTVIK